MAKMGNTVETYVVQWLETATKGNVIVTFAFVTNRMQLHCKICNCEHTCRKPESNDEIDYSVQEFVKLHAHVGGHKNPTKIDKMIAEEFKDVEGIPLTADFKKIGKIDDKLSSAAIIENQMQKYELEIQQKLANQAFSNKIKILQLMDAAKVAKLPKLPEPPKQKSNKPLKQVTGRKFR